MLYDLAKTPPAPRSLLESVFLLVSIRRRESELFQTQALVTAILGAAAGSYEPVEEALKSYKDTMFPFLEAERVKKSDMEKEALKQWTSHQGFRVRPLWTAHAGGAKKLRSRLRKVAERNQQAEALRKKSNHVRI